MAKFTVTILMLVFSVAAASQQPSHPKCEASISGLKIHNVYIIGDQYEAVAWAYKHIALESCLTPTLDPAKADAILELQPLLPTGSPAYDTSANVNCNSSAGTTTCIDSTGNELSVDCNRGGCEPSYGPTPFTTMTAGYDAFASTHWEEANAFLYSNDHKQLWSSDQQRGSWYGADWIDKLRLGTNTPECKIGTFKGSKYKNYRHWARTNCGVEFDPVVSIDIKLMDKQAAQAAGTKNRGLNSN